MIDLYLFQNALRDLMRPRKLFAAALLILAPCLIVLLQRFAFETRRFDAAEIYNNYAQYLVFGFVMVILAVVFCTSVITQEVEDKTIVYLLTRPIARWRILSIKFLPALLLTTLTVWCALLLLGLAAFGPAGIHGTALLHDLEMTPLGVLAYGALFLLLATLLYRPLIYGLLYAFGWETWVPNLPGSFQKLSLMAYLRVLTPHTIAAPENVDITQALTTVPQDTISSRLAWIVLIAVIVGAFACALFAFSVREYVPRDTE